MSELSFYINGILSPPPEDWGNLEIELDFENESNDASIKTQVFTWKGENAAKLYKWFTDGLLSAHVGIFEGPPFRIENCDPAVTIFNGCINMTSPDTRFQCDIVTAAVKETIRTENTFDRLGGFSFAFLRSQNIITPADKVMVPYVVSTIPDYFQVAILTTSFIEMSRILKDTWVGLKSLADKFAGDTTASAATLGATIALIIWDVIVMIFYVAYILFLISLLVDLFLIIINNIIQPVKYKAGMLINTMLTKAAQYIGLSGFSSTILQGAPFNNRLAIIPTKKAFFNNNTFIDQFFGNAFSRKWYDDAHNTTGPFAATWWYEGTPLELIRQLEDVFNGKGFVRNNVLHFEVWDFSNNQSSFTMPNQSSDAPYQDPFGTNADELSANYIVEFARDTDDYNTYDNYEGTIYSMTLHPVTTINPLNILLKGLTNKQLAFARATRKKQLTVPEKIFNFFYNAAATLMNPLIAVVNFVANLVGANTIPPLPLNTFGARIGVMLLDNDFIGIQKLVLLDSSNKVDLNNDVYVTAKYLQEQYHSHSWAINTLTSPPGHNQYKTFKDKEIPLCCSDFQLIRNNNIINTFDQKKGRVDSLRWNPHTGIARIDFRVKEKYTNNLTQTLIDGQD